MSVFDGKMVARDAALNPLRSLFTCLPGGALAIKRTLNHYFPINTGDVMGD